MLFRRLELEFTHELQNEFQHRKDESNVESLSQEKKSETLAAVPRMHSPIRMCTLRASLCNLVYGISSIRFNSGHVYSRYLKKHCKKSEEHRVCSIILLSLQKLPSAKKKRKLLNLPASMLSLFVTVDDVFNLQWREMKRVGR